MTLAADNALDWIGSDGERRGRAAEPRRSWASTRPFVERETPFNHEAAHTLKWPEVAGGYRRRVAVTDAVAALVVGAAFGVPIYGLDLVTAGMVVAGMLGFVLLVAVVRGYDTKTLGDGPDEFQAVVRAGVGGAIALMVASFVFKAELSRLFVLAGVPVLIGVVALGRVVHRKILHRQRAAGDAMMRTLVVGEPSAVTQVTRDLSKASYHGYQVTGLCLPGLDDEVPLVGVPVIGAVADVPQVVVDHAVDVVVVAGSYLSGDGLRRLSWALDRVGAQLIVVPDIVEVTAPRLTVRPTAGLPLLQVEVGASRRQVLTKAVMDRVLGTLLLLAASPVILVSAAAVRINSPGSAFYRQTRIGVDGESFTMWKLRSMYIDAEERRAALLGSNESDGVLFKMREDPRVTPVGKVLRRFSIDELPQLLNVVKGDMSLVGPRPPLASEVADYADSVHRRLRVKPGLTGLWQVSGRSDLSWEESVRLDLRYVDNWSVTMDVMILWKTARAVLGADGAY